MKKQTKMEQPTDRQYTAFISHASEDVAIVKNIETLFEKMGHHVFYAPITLKEKAGDEWIKQVINGMKNSTCIIPIYTRNSIRKPWVIYELGVADAFGLPKYPAMVAEVSVDEASTPGKQVQAFKLFDTDDLIDLFTNVVNLQENPSNNERMRDSIKVRTTHLLRCDETNEIIKLAKTRDVFIAGNVPVYIEKKGISKKETIMTESEFQEKAKIFLPRLTRRLLEHGFSISSCPQVKRVGNVVTTEAIAWITKNQQPTDRYKIGGIYPIDNALRELDVDDRFKEIWESQLLEFRKWYLEPQEWLLILGGNDGTKEEYSAARQLNVKVFPLRCFGGAGRALWNTHEELQRPPCNGCKQLDGNCSDQAIDALIKTLLNED